MARTRLLVVDDDPDVLLVLKKDMDGGELAATLIRTIDRQLSDPRSGRAQRG